ncbi:probable transcription repressor OFP9 [Triticum dicoccoides]|uniref:probable transcription repressor OFP9 n=1 Tax=Triticum dicoccoides TaxID=85692 RepID=UPI00188E2FB1|nr:probable transcription repressor OFP9 [Triticum dicoccoides]
MHFFSGRSKLRQKNGGGKNQADASAAPKAKHKDGRCRALCCGASRLSVSSSASCSSLDAPDTTCGRMSDIAHGMVQARLHSMVDAASADGRSSATRRGTELADQRRRWPCVCSCASGGGGGCYEKSAPRPRERKPCVVLVAVDRRTYEPREEFRRSIAEVIAAKRMAEPAELRALLNCYVSVNAREHRAAILDAFHEVCTGLFACKG